MKTEMADWSDIKKEADRVPSPRPNGWYCGDCTGGCASVATERWTGQGWAYDPAAVARRAKEGGAMQK